MNAPPPDEIDILYRQSSGTHPSRPAERTRQNILRHAAQIALRHSSRPRSVLRHRARYAMFATAAAAVFAGLMVVPRFLREPLVAPLPSAAMIANAPNNASRTRGEQRSNQPAEKTAAVSEKTTARGAAGADRAAAPSALDAQRHTALMLAILRDDAAAVDALLSQGVDAAEKDEDGTTPLQAATLRGQPAIIHALQTALHGAAAPARR